jgi:hypothetical protein
VVEVLVRVSNADNQIKLVFNLDEAQHTKIEKNTVVRIVKGVESAANLPPQPAAMTLIPDSISGRHQDHIVGEEELFTSFYLLLPCFYFVSLVHLLKGPLS